MELQAALDEYTAGPPCEADDPGRVVDEFYSTHRGNPLFQFSWADDFDDETLARLEERSKREQEEVVEIKENPSCGDLGGEADGGEVVVVTAAAEPVLGEVQERELDECMSGEGHLYREFTARDSDYKCSACDVAVASGTQLFGCQHCRHDLCTTCRAKIATSPPIPLPPLPPIPADMGTGGHAIEPVNAAAVNTRPPTTYGHKKALRLLKRKPPAQPSAHPQRPPRPEPDQQPPEAPLYYSHTPYAVPMSSSSSSPYPSADTRTPHYPHPYEHAWSRSQWALMG